MDSRMRREVTALSRDGRVIEPATHDKIFRLGVDVGSTSSDIVLLGEDSTVLFSDYCRTMGRPIETVRSQLSKLSDTFALAGVETAAVTGAAGRVLAEILEVPFINEVSAQAAAISHLYPDLEQASVIEMGGQDTKLIFLNKQDGRMRMQDFALNTVCAAGTGSFLDQQAQRLGVNIEDEFGQLALASKSVPRMAGRCSVFAKSDMIHLQQQATPNCDIIAGLCLALARNLKSNLGCGRDFVRPIIFTGGVAANVGVIKALEQVFELESGELLVPDEHFFTGAIGAVLIAKNKGTRERSGAIQLGRLDEYLTHKGSVLKRAPRRELLGKPTLPPPVSRVYSELLDEADGPLDAYLGVDVGSISTNVVVMDPQRRVLSKAYLMTAGKPLEAVRQGLDIVGKEVVGRVKILGAATTGSGRYLTGDFIGADIVINEITAQAAGAAIVNPKVDTIFEIGGQDSKYISLENGVVVDFEMNHACAAGTGSFLEEQAQRLGINIKEEFASLAFESEAPIKLGERCTVFMESDLLSYQQQGAQIPDLVAGLSYSIVANYLDRVVGRRKIGDNICFQGGTAFNKAVWSAFEEVLGKPVMVPDHHEVTGALGAASIAAEHMSKLAEQAGEVLASQFRGFENLVHIEYTVESFTCEHCPNNCEIKKVQLPGSEPLYYGSRCDRYNLKKKTLSDSGFDAFRFRRTKMLQCAALSGKSGKAIEGKTTIGIPRALVFWQQLPLYSRFFQELGFEVVLSGDTDKSIIRQGVELVTAQTCFPVKVAYGHIAELLKRQPDYIFIPSIVSMTASFPNNKHNQLCPYVQSFAYQVQTAFADKLGRTKILSLPMRFGEGKKLFTKSFTELGGMLGVSASQVRSALRKAVAAQEEFDTALKQKGAEILSKVGLDKKLFVLVSRPYNGCDSGVNLQLPKKLAEHGVDVIPMDMLDLDNAPLSDEHLHRSVYWSYGQKILRAAEVIKNDPRLFAIYLSNFGCGPDSFLLTFFKDIMAEKPCLQLELDEHSADAGVITRIEAFLESLKHYKGRDKLEDRRAKPCWLETVNKDRTLYIPYMGDAAYGVAAVFRSYGQPAEVMPLADEQTLIKGRRFTTGKECLPCAITTGDMLKLIETNEHGKLAFFMPGGSGPCRFGMYNCMHRLVLKYTDALNIPVVSPNQDDRFYSQFKESLDGTGATSLMKDVWVGAAGIDLLGKLILRLRPFAASTEHIQRVYRDSVRRYVEAVEKRTTFAQKVELMASIAGEFSRVEMDYALRKPRIGIVGEIYVRSHPFANSNIIARLEELGAACDLASLAEWIYYTNCTRTRMAGRRGQFRHLLSNVTQDFFQHRFEKALARPLEEKFGPLVEGRIEHVLKLASAYLHDSFEGEAVLSVGKMVEYHHQGFGGVVNVMPFTCMPSTIVSTQTMRISKDCGGMPILNLSFDGQEDPTLTTRLEAFVEQVASRQTTSIGELISA
jgi:predicted CoA-substrate-specific enzyme activase